MMSENLRKVLASVAVSALLAGPALAEGDDVSAEEPEVSVDPMPGGEPDMWTGGSPDFCEACTGEPVDEPVSESGDDVTDLGVDPEEIEPRIRETMADGEGAPAQAQTRATPERSGDQCVWTTRNMYCAD